MNDTKNYKLSELYKAYNGLAEYYYLPDIPDQFPIIDLYKRADNFILSDEISKILCDSFKNQTLFCLENGLKLVQSKSIFARIQYIDLVASSIPSDYYKRIGFSKESIVGISLAIVLYYLSLNSYLSGLPVSATDKKNLFGRTDCFFGFEEIKKVRGKTTKAEFERYVEFYSINVNDIKGNSIIGLFNDNGLNFIICIADFLDYILLITERIFKKQVESDEWDEYARNKGVLFENAVYNFANDFFEEAYYSLNYINQNQKYELDIVIKEGEKITILECKSGTIDLNSIENDEKLEKKLKGYTKKAYNTLNNALSYFKDCADYCLKNNEITISGKVSFVTGIHVSMYPLNSVSSNVHTIFKEYLRNDDPILTISFEHLMAILLDLKRRNKSFYEYVDKRKKQIYNHPQMKFDNNELDLYYEMMNVKNPILDQMEQLGFLNSVATSANIISTFRNETGNEFRPAKEMLESLDNVFLSAIMIKAKPIFGINKRYINSFNSYLCKE